MSVTSLAVAPGGGAVQSGGYLQMGAEGIKKWDESITMYRGDLESADDDQREDESDDSEEISSNEDPRTPISW